MIIDTLFRICNVIAGVLAGVMPDPVPAWLIQSAASMGYILGWCSSYSVFVPWDVLLDMSLGLIGTGFVYFAFHLFRRVLQALHLIG